jgi:hypothetical protein
VAHDDAHLPGPAERHHHERSDRGLEAFGEAKIEGLVEGHIESDARDSHRGKGGAKKGLKTLWITL